MKFVSQQAPSSAIVESPVLNKKTTLIDKLKNSAQRKTCGKIYQNIIEQNQKKEINKSEPSNLPHYYPFKLKFSHLGSTKHIETQLSQSYLQGVMNQACVLMNTYLSNLSQKFSDII